MLGLPWSLRALDRSPVARRKLQKRAFNDIDRGTFGGLVFTARRLHGLTQAQVATAIGRDRPWLSDVETGKITFVPEDDIQALSQTLDLDARQLTSARDGAQARLGHATADMNRRRACQICSHLNPESANFCSNCGTQVPASIECDACGGINDSMANFCMNCGRAFGARAAPRSRLQP